jgi:hypothetical protein
VDRENAGGGHLAREAASTANYIAIPDDTASVARRSGVVDLDLERRRRLLTPWPGFWGGAGEMRSWTWAERSGRVA